MPTSYSNSYKTTTSYSIRATGTTTFDYLLMENGGYILQEDGVSKFIIGSNTGNTSYSVRITP